MNRMIETSSVFCLPHKSSHFIDFPGNLPPASVHQNCKCYHNNDGCDGCPNYHRIVVSFSATTFQRFNVHISDSYANVVV